MSKLRAAAFVALVVVCLTGCFEVDQEYTLNPDGSGKVVHRLTQPDLLGQGEAGLKQLVEQQLSEAAGVDAWSDVTVESIDGSLQFEGTAYFSDLNELRLGGGGMNFRWDPRAGRLYLATDEQSAGTPLPSEQIGEAVSEARSEWKKVRPMLQGLLGSLRWHAAFNLPAEVSSASSFDRPSPRRVEIGIEGEKYFEILDSLMTDDEALRSLAASGSLESIGPEGESLPAAIVPLLFGGEAVEVMTTRGGKAQFDYAAEVAAADDAREVMMASLPVDAPRPLAPAAEGGSFQELSVVQVSFVIDAEQAWSEEGATVSVVGRLPGSVLSVEEGELLEAVSDDGQILLPEDEWRRSISASLDSNDPTLAKFDVHLQLPSTKARGFKSIAGKIHYLSSSEPDSEVELFRGIRDGGEGLALGARISAIEEGYSEGTEHLTIDVDVPREEIGELIFHDARGRAVDAQLVSTSWNDESTSLVYAYEGQFPRDGRVLAKVRKGIKRYEIPFRLSNLDLTGRPR